jgi:hypothetical protein
MINEAYKNNFATMERAFAAKDVAILECQDKRTGKVVIAVCATQREPGGTTAIVPLAKMFDGNPYEELNPPSQDGGWQGDVRTVRPDRVLFWARMCVACEQYAREAGKTPKDRKEVADYCRERREQALKEGFDDTATYLQHIIEDMQ